MKVPMRKKQEGTMKVINTKILTCKNIQNVFLWATVSNINNAIAGAPSSLYRILTIC